MSAATVAERVAAGAAYLDEHEPGWWHVIDLDHLDIASECGCILGQLHGGEYDDALEVRGIWTTEARALGFDAVRVDSGGEYAVLTAAWRDLITARRAEVGAA